MKQLFAAIVAGFALLAGITVLYAYAADAITAGQAAAYVIPASIVAGVALKNI